MSRVDTIRAIPSFEAIQAKKFVQKTKGKETLTLALDLSTSCVGWAIGTRTEIFSYGKFVFADRDIGEKLHAFSLAVMLLLRTYEPEYVLVERPMSRRGKTTALHNQLLGVVRWAMFEWKEMELLDSHLVSPITVKRRLGVPKGQNHQQNKILMLEHINNVLNIKLKFHPNSKIQSQDDIADAIAILLARYADV